MFHVYEKQQNGRGHFQGLNFDAESERWFENYC